MPSDRQFKILADEVTEAALHETARALGFHTANAYAAVWLKQVAALPPERVFEVMALVSQALQGPRKPRRSRR